MEFPRRPLLQELQRNCALLSQVLIENTVPVDVASPLEVNHINIVLCDCICVIVALICLSLLLHECFFQFMSNIHGHQFTSGRCITVI